MSTPFLLSATTAMHFGPAHSRLCSTVMANDDTSSRPAMLPHHATDDASSAVRRPYRVIISGGGTGGHIFPAIAIANAFKKRYPNAEILFVGAENRMEMERVPAAGYRIVGLPVYGFDRKRPFKNIAVLCKLIKSLRIARKVVREFRPDVAIGVGGYASGPTLWMASRLRVPCLIQEQNSYAGVTNRLLSKRVSTICVAYDGMERFFPADKIVMTGNPVRSDLEHAAGSRAEAAEHFGLDPAKTTVLIIGGSLGARTLNAGMLKGLQALLDSGIQLIWQTGRFYHASIRQQLADVDTKNRLWYSDFISRMDYAYAMADLVVSRAGASSVSELCVLGKPSILIPSPNVAEDHQTKNAMAIVDKQAAIMLADKDAETALASTILQLVHDKEQLQHLARQIARLAHRRSAEAIADEIEKIIKQQ